LCKTTKRGSQKSFECPLTLGVFLHGGTHYCPKHLGEKKNVKEEKSNVLSRTLMSFEGIKNQWEGRIQEVS